MADSFQLPDLEGKVDSQRSAGSALIGAQQGLTDAFLNKYTDTINNQGTTAALAGKLGQESGLPQLRENAFKLNQRVFNTPYNNLKGTTGSDVSQTQLDHMNSYDLQKLVPLAQNATSLAQNAQQSVDTQLGYAQNDWNRQLLPLNSEQSFLTDRIARETSMFSQENQNELNSLVAKMQAGVTLSEGEKNRAQQLSIAEMGYENALKIATMNNQYKTLGTGDGLYNTQTGSLEVKRPLNSFYK